MSNLMEQSNSVGWISLFAVLVYFTPSHLFAADDIHGALQRCASIGDASERLDCYDGLSGRKHPVLPVVVAPVEAPAEISITEKLSGETKPKVAVAAVATKVTRCTKGSRGKYLFYLEGGEVWKQISDKRLWFKSCDFGATVSKDLFGYKMQIDGEKSSVRVSRVR